MDETIYCPKCAGKEHKKHTNVFVDTHWSVKAVRVFREFFAVHLFGVVFVRRRHSAEVREETFTPESFRCQHCGYYFLSSETYAEEIRWSKRFKKWGIILGLIHLLLAALMAAYLIAPSPTDYWSTGTAGKIGGLIVSAVVCFICLHCALSSAKTCKKLTAEWKEFRNAQAKQLKSVSGSSTQQIPTWKRLQTEQQESV